MYPVRPALAITFAVEAALLVAVAATAGLRGPGWVVGAAAAVASIGLVALGCRRHRRRAVGPADLVTLARVALAVTVAALAADGTATPLLVALAAVALALDAVDGPVARRTGTASEFGASFDMEADAALILVLSVDVARGHGLWVLTIGAARYLLALAAAAAPWLRAPSPRRTWRRVVAGVQGVALLYAAAGIGPRGVGDLVLLTALVLLVTSFATQVVWLRRHRSADAAPTPRGVAGVATALAVGLLWFALVAPDQLDHLSLAAFARIPVEGLLLLAAVLVLPDRARPAAATLAGALLGALTVLKFLDMGFFATLDRPFDPVVDWTYFGSAEGLLGDSIGHRAAVVAVVGAALLVLGVLVLTPLAARRVARAADRHRGRTLPALGAAAAVWVLCAVSGFQLVTGDPIASTSAATLAWDRVGLVRTSLRDEGRFAATLTSDPAADAGAAGRLPGLRGKDVVVVFVESYGRVAVQGSALSTGVDRVLDAGTTALAADGWSARSAFLTSPTYGGASWLAHSTLQSGLWVDNQLRYDELVTSPRPTLSRVFGAAGWHTVVDVPSNRQAWPQARSYYGYDTVYGEQDVGYAGPKFSYAAMPDQFTLQTFAQRQLAPTHRAPVMAEIDLVSSHFPWTPLPRLVDPNLVGDGSIYDSMPAQGPTVASVWSDPTRVRAAYGQSIEYSLASVISFVRTSHDDDLVLVMLGDHQPSSVVSGDHASRDVPITIIAHDPAVLGRTNAWGWVPGLRPPPDAPVWRMDAFRDRFLAAYR